MSTPGRPGRVRGRGGGPYPRTSRRAGGTSRASGPGAGRGAPAVSSMPGRGSLADELLSGIGAVVGVGSVSVDSVRVCAGRSRASSSSSAGAGGDAMAVCSACHLAGGRRRLRSPLGVLSARILRLPGQLTPVAAVNGSRFYPAAGARAPEPRPVPAPTRAPPQAPPTALPRPTQALRP